MSKWLPANEGLTSVTLSVRKHLVCISQESGLLTPGSCPQAADRGGSRSSLLGASSLSETSAAGGQEDPAKSTSHTQLLV